MTGAAAGSLSGLLGASCLEIHCPNLDASHILVGHLGVAVVCAAARLAIGLVTEIRLFRRTQNNLAARLTPS
jgi:hypothetical protein